MLKMTLRDLRCLKQDNRAEAKIINNLLRELRDAGIKLLEAMRASTREINRHNAQLEFALVQKKYNNMYGFSIEIYIHSLISPLRSRN
jgi:hypothetical protein